MVQLNRAFSSQCKSMKSKKCNNDNITFIVKFFSDYVITSTDIKDKSRDKFENLQDPEDKNPGENPIIT